MTRPNCNTCLYKQINPDDSAWCYMFDYKPTDEKLRFCMQWVSDQDSANTDIDIDEESEDE